MFYRYALLVPAGTPVNAPVEAEFKLDAGVIHRVIVKFPPGCHQRVYFAIYQGANQQFPTGPSGWFQGDGENLDFPEHVTNKHGYHWYMKGASPTARHDHTITVRIGVLRKEDISPFTIVKDLVDIFKVLLGRKGD